MSSQKNEEKSISDLLVIARPECVVPGRSSVSSSSAESARMTSCLSDLLCESQWHHLRTHCYSHGRLHLLSCCHPCCHSFFSHSSLTSSERTDLLQAMSYNSLCYFILTAFQMLLQFMVFYVDV